MNEQDKARAVLGGLHLLEARHCVCKLIKYKCSSCLARQILSEMKEAHDVGLTFPLKLEL